MDFFLFLILIFATRMCYFPIQKKKKKISLGKYEGIMVIQNLQQKEVKGRKGGREREKKEGQDGGGKKRGKGGRQK